MVAQLRSTSLFRSSCCPRTCSRLDLSLQARVLQHCLSSTDLSAAGVVICCGGQRARLMRLSSANWALAAWQRWIQELAPLPAASLPLGRTLCRWTRKHSKHITTLFCSRSGASLIELGVTGLCLASLLLILGLHFEPHDLWPWS